MNLIWRRVETSVWSGYCAQESAADKLMYSIGVRWRRPERPPSFDISATAVTTYSMRPFSETTASTTGGFMPMYRVVFAEGREFRLVGDLIPILGKEFDSLEAAQAACEESFLLYVLERVS